LALGFAQSYRPRSIFYLYVLKQTAERVEVVEEMEGDIFLRDLLVEDINADGVCEIALSGRGETSISGWLFVWSVEQDGGLRKIGFDNYEGFNPALKSRGQRFEIETHETRQLGDRRQETTYYYTWDQGVGRYVLRDSTAIVCGPE
jgi:hypothetical protein